MKEFSAFIRKEFYHIFRDTRTLMILILLPIILIMLFSFAISVEIRNVNIGILAPSNENTINQLVHKIEASEYFHITHWLNSPIEADSLMRANKVDLVLAFGDHFDQRMLSTDGAQLGIIVDGSNPNNASMETMYLMGLLQSYFGEKASAVPSPNASLTTNVRMLYNPQSRSAYNFVPGIMGLILILICALMTSVSIVREKETGTMEVLLISPVKPIHIILAKMIPYLIISCIVLSIILTLSFTVLGIPMLGTLHWIILVSLVYILLSLSIGLFVSNMVDSQLVATLICAVVFMMPILLLSGMLFPIESMPKFFQVVSNIIPARWYISAIKKLMIQGVEFQFVLKEFTILCAMTLLLITASLKKFKEFI